MYRILPFVVLLVTMLSCHRQEKGFEQIYAPFLQTETSWADSMLLEMTLEEKIGQLLVLQSTESIATDTLANWIQNGRLGAWMPEGISLSNYLHLTDTLQQIARIPLMMGTRQVVALNNQFTDIQHYPSPATISAIGSTERQVELLEQYIKQCKALGIHFSLTPSLSVADTLDNHFDYSAMENDPEAQMFWSYTVMNRLQEEVLLSVGAPFGKLYYADEADINDVGIRDSLMHRYFNLSQNGLSGLLIDNAVFRADTNRFYPADFLTDYLHKYTSFDGLAFGVPDSMTTAFDLLHGGVDVLVIKSAPWLYQQQIKESVDMGFLSMEQLNKKVRKMLQAKTWLGLDVCPPKNDMDYARQLMAKENHELPVYQLYEEALTLANNPDSLIPFRRLEKEYFKLVSVGEGPVKNFISTFQKYANYNLYRKVGKEENGGWEALSLKQLKTNTVILTLADIVLETATDSAFIASVNALSNLTKVVLINFGSPLNLRHFDARIHMVQSYERNVVTESLAAQLLFGGLSAKGRLPLALADHLPFHQGFSNEVIRLKYGLPQEVGIAPHKLVGIDAIVYNAIQSGAMPGCQVLVVKEGKVIYDKEFGHHTYRKQSPIRGMNIYDLASVTKIAATSLAAMKLYESGRFRLSHHIDNLLGVDNTTLKKITIENLFTHRSGLQSFLPITPYLNNRDTVVNGCNNYFCKIKQGDYDIPIADSMYFNHTYNDTIWKDIHQIKPKRRKRYLYSDLNFMLLQRVVEKLSATPMDVYLGRHFYRPLNMTRTGFNPLKRFSISQIAPTEKDSKWRNQQIRGYVHDESAALMGGVAGNAGLFSNANDLATLFQMLLNKGSYGGKEYLKPKTIDRFTRFNRSGRGLGFEVKTKSGVSSCSPYASNGTYGHRGFTGTCVWVDPKNELIFIFLTNRIYPNYKNGKLMRSKVRQRVHSVIYRALNSYEEPVPFENNPLPAVASFPGDEKDTEG